MTNKEISRHDVLWLWGRIEARRAEAEAGNRIATVGRDATESDDLQGYQRWMGDEAKKRSDTRLK